MHYHALASHHDLEPKERVEEANHQLDRNFRLFNHLLDRGEGAFCVSRRPRHEIDHLLAPT